MSTTFILINMQFKELFSEELNHHKKFWNGLCKVQRLHLGPQYIQNLLWDLIGLRMETEGPLWWTRSTTAQSSVRFMHLSVVVEELLSFDNGLCKIVLPLILKAQCSNCWHRNLVFELFLEKPTIHGQLILQTSTACDLLFFPVGNYIFKVNNGNTRTRCNKVWNMFKVNNEDTRTTPMASFWCT